MQSIQLKKVHYAVLAMKMRQLWSFFRSSQTFANHTGRWDHLCTWARDFETGI